VRFRRSGRLPPSRRVRLPLRAARAALSDRSESRVREADLIAGQLVDPTLFRGVIQAGFGIRHQPR
jgi:hypothetical protein